MPGWQHPGSTAQPGSHIVGLQPHLLPKCHVKGISDPPFQHNDFSVVQVHGLKTIPWPRSPLFLGGTFTGTVKLPACGRSTQSTEEELKLTWIIKLVRAGLKSKATCSKTLAFPSFCPVC